MHGLKKKKKNHFFGINLTLLVYIHNIYLINPLSLGICMEIIESL